jgi:hypothetical protein
LVCRLNAIPIKIPTGLFGRRWWNDSKIYVEEKNPGVTRTLRRRMRQKGTCLSDGLA